MKFTGSEDPVLSRPFTIVDPKKTVWTVATNRVWLVAVKGLNAGPRFQGDSSSLNTILNLLRVEPQSPRKVKRKAILEDLGGDLIKVFGVVVGQKLFKDLLIELPDEEVTLWDATGTFQGIPGLGFISGDWRAFLMGFEGVPGEVPVLSLPDVSKDLFELAMSLDED